MIEVIGSIITGVMSGGATGLLGIALQQWGEAKKRAADIEMARVQHAQTLELRRLDDAQQVRLAEMTAASAERLAGIQAEARAIEAASADYRASVEADRTTYLTSGAQDNSRAARLLMAAVDFLRGIVRPGVTVYGLVLLTMLLAWVRDMHQRAGMPLSSAEQMRLTMEVVTTITYLSTTATVWWFGARPARSGSGR